MSARYLLDTNIVSDLVRHPDGAVTRRLKRVGEEAVATSIVVACELRFGTAKKGSQRLSAQLALILERLLIVPLEPPADAYYGALRAKLESEGTPVGANDVLIAAQALALGLTLVTDDEREFSRVEGLKIENWLR